MATINIEKLGEDVLYLIKSQPWFPYKTGKLKFQATSGQMVNDNTYCIHFDSTIAPYVEALEEGSKPHDIPGAFGKALPFGIGGRFDGKFHPGSTKHQGFISNKSVSTIIDYITSKYGGVNSDFIK